MELTVLTPKAVRKPGRLFPLALRMTAALFLFPGAVFDRLGKKSR